MPKYKGRLTSLTQPTTSGTPYTGVANGIWSSQDELVAINAGVWTKGLTVPDMPTIGSAIAANNSSAVSFTAPSDIGGSPITSYVAKSNLGTTITGATSPITFTGLTNGTAYTFTVAALNAQGSIPHDHFHTMRCHPQFKSELAPFMALVHQQVSQSRSIEDSLKAITQTTYLPRLEESL